jgi:excinuclease ABC subunit B
MKFAQDETERRRKLQGKYNEEHGITPATIVRAVMHINMATGTTDYVDVPKIPKGKGSADADVDLDEKIQALRVEMFTAAEALDFEKAARLRDELKRLQGLAGPEADGPPGAGYDPYSAKRKASGRGKAATKKASPAAKKRATSKWKPR